MAEPASSSFIGKLIFGVASATVIGGGTTVLSLARNDAVQDTRISQVEKHIDRMDELSKKLDVTNTKVDVLNARLEEKEKVEHVPRQ